MEFESYDALWRAYHSWSDKLSAQIIFNGNVRLGRRDPSKYDSGFYESIDPETVRKSIDYFIKKMSRKLFGTRRVLNGQLLNYAGMIHGGAMANTCGGPRMHFHIGVSGIPPEIDLIWFSKLMKQEWEKGKWGYRNTFAQPCYGDGWKAYVLKKFSPMKTENFVTNLPYYEA